jgi:hypothetical protein
MREISKGLFRIEEGPVAENVMAVLVREREALTHGRDSVRDKDERRSVLQPIRAGETVWQSLKEHGNLSGALDELEDVGQAALLADTEVFARLTRGFDRLLWRHGFVPTASRLRP